MVDLREVRGGTRLILSLDDRRRVVLLLLLLLFLLTCLSEVPGHHVGQLVEVVLDNAKPFLAVLRLSKDAEPAAAEVSWH